MPVECVARRVAAGRRDIAVAPPLLAAVAELVPELRSHRPDIPPLARLDPESERFRLLDALTQVFVALARPRPLLIILEDLHRAGTATIDAIGAILPRLTRLTGADRCDVPAGRGRSQSSPASARARVPAASRTR